MYIVPLNILSIRVSFFGKNIFRERFSLIGSNAKAPAYTRSCIQTRVQFGRKHVFPFSMIAIAVGSRNPNLIQYIRSGPELKTNKSRILVSKSQ